MPELQTYRGTVHYDEQGSGEPLLLLHANPGDPRDFDAIVPALARHYRVIRLAWPGYGESPAPLPPSSATAMQYAELLEQFVLKMDLKGLRIIGNSLGAYAAACLALRRPERVGALVLVAPAGFTTHTRFTEFFCKLKGSERFTRWFSGLLALFYLRVKTAVTQAMRERARGEQRRPEAVAVNAALWRSFLRPEFDLREAAQYIEAKTLVIAGRRDPLIRVVDAVCADNVIPTSNLIVLPSGHAPYAEVPELFLAVTEPFLARCLAPARMPPSAALA